MTSQLTGVGAGDDEESTLCFGLDFSIPLVRGCNRSPAHHCELQDDIEENEMKPKPTHHEFGG